MMKQTPLSADRKALLAALDGSDYTLASASRAVGRNQAYLHQFMYRNSPRILPEALRHQLAQLLRISHQTLLSDSQRTQLPSSDTEQINGDTLIIPLFDIHSAAGAASFLDHATEQQMDSWHFSRAVLQSLPHSNLDNLSLLHVRGDSMSPLLEDGDIIMIDRGQIHPEPAGIFVLDDGFGLVAKRLVLIADERAPRVRIISVNPDFVPYRRALDEIRIIGRVIWMARSLK